MRAFQFWVLLLGSLFVSILLIKQIFISKAIYAEHRLLVDNEEIATTGEAYQTAWKQLAVHIYQGSRQDPPLAAVLKNERVVISTAAPAPPTPPQATAPSSKMPAPPAPATSVSQ